jgi:hypothetical protein
MFATRSAKSFSLAGRSKLQRRLPPILHRIEKPHHFIARQTPGSYLSAGLDDFRPRDFPPRPSTFPADVFPEQVPRSTPATAPVASMAGVLSRRSERGK